MAEAIQAKADVRGAIAGLDKLGGELATHLARSMCVAGGKVLRDEAKLLAPVGTEEGGSIYPGALRDSIYLAFKDSGSDMKHIRYAVSWNAKKAPHGHLLEFGHWRYNKIVNGYPQKSLKPGLTKGRGPQDHEGPGALDKPVWMPAHPFLRPALDMAGAMAQQAMIDRGRERLPELLQGVYQPPDEDFV